MGRITITNHGLTGYSSLFNSTFATDRVINTSSFGPSIDFALAGNVRDAIEVADFDDDGKEDLVVVENYSTAKIFKNTQATAGQSITAASLTVEATTYSSGYNITALDIDGDGKVDLNSGFNLFQNTSSGSLSFSTGVSTSAASFNYVAAADFNKDGKTDLAVTNGSANIQIYQNQSSKGTYAINGKFAPFNSTAISLAKPNNYGGVVAADFDGDGYDDLASTSSIAGVFTHYRNLKQYGPITVSSFLPGINVVTGSQPYSLTANDFDGDGKIDIAITHYNSAFISIFRNISSLGNISFATSVDIACLSKGYNIASQDLDGDGKAEIVVIHRPNPGPGSFSVFKNNSSSGSVSFAAVVNYSVGTHNTLALAIADINLDQKPDILIVGDPYPTGTNALMVFENKIASGPPITITQQPASPFNACEGSSATLSTDANGTPNITYQWQKFNSGNSLFENLTNNIPYSGVTTKTLSIASITTAEGGNYRCLIKGDLATDVITNVSNVVFNNLPVSPIVTNGASCGPGSVTLVASGASAGNYRWYTQSPITPISSEVNGTYITPSLSSTTTYLVSIANSFCESVKVPIVATIATPPSSPVITSSTTPVGNSITVCSSSVLTLSAPTGFSGYLWSTGAATQQLIVNTSGLYSVVVTDGSGCVSPASTNLDVTVVPAPCNNSAPVINPTSLTTTIGGKTSINLLDLISDADNNLVPSSLIVLVQPTSGATTSITNGILLIDYTGINFTGTDQLTIQVCDVFGECVQQQLEIKVIGELVIYNAVSPNGDFKNEIFRLEYIDLIPETQNNTVTIYNRWGSKVFEVENYNNNDRAFKGLNENGNELPSGTYFYKIAFNSGKKSESGYLVLKR